MLTSFIPPNHDFNKNRTQDSVEASFKKNLNATDMAALKSSIESNYTGVSLIFSGKEFDYDVVVQGPTLQFQKAMNSLFPKGRSDIIRQPAQTLP